MKYKHRYIARIVMEARTPLRIGAGKNSMTSDSVVMRDANGLPYIPGTTLAGVLRHSFAESTNDEAWVNRIFGFQDADKGHGSTFICSSALLIGAEGKVLDGLFPVDWTDPFYACLRTLPIRQHVCINDRGHAAHGGKFDEEIVYKGTRFCFEVELLAEYREKVTDFEKNLLPLLSSATFRLGGGTRKGFGEMRVHAVTQRYYNLGEPADLALYLEKSASLADAFEGETQTSLPTADAEGWTEYALELTPKDFFLFGSGFADDEADMTPVKEAVVVYDDNTGHPSLRSERILVPAASIKGALAHRTAFYYNRQKGIYAETPDKPASNVAVEQLFGSEEKKTRGHFLFSDIHFQDPAATTDKLFNHVAIDRFTGGAMDGALYNEKATYAPGVPFTLKILVSDKVSDPEVRAAFESALDDLCTGYLPLGGCTNHGHGIFIGTKKVVKNGTIQ